MHFADATPKVLVACSDYNFKRYPVSPYIGRLLTPIFFGDKIHRYTGIDNFAYTDWKPERFMRLLNKHKDSARVVKWVCCPDVVGDWKTTYNKFEGWHYLLKELGYDSAYVVQDNQPIDRIPWSEISCVFLGGTDAYKMSWDAIRMCREAKNRNKLVHIGRVNSITRITRFIDVMDSFDGMSYSRYGNTHLPKLLNYLNKRNKCLDTQ